MSRKPPEALVGRVLDTCRRWDMLPRGGLVLCAVSGGRDSMALLHLLRGLAGEEGFSLAVAHFDHRLRPAAERDAAFVREQCRAMDIPCHTGSGDVAAAARETGRSLEDAARQMRYDFLERTADRVGAVRIATAHHRQDNAETLLLNLTRGAGLQGLAGIPPVRGRIVRPLLEVDRGEIDRYVADHRIPYVEDETNADPAYARRNRLRLEVLPLLEEISPGCTGRMTRAAALLREEDCHLQREIDALLPQPENGAVSIPVRLLQEHDTATARRLVRTMARRLGRELTAAQTEAVLALGSGGCLDLGGGVGAVRKSHQLTLREKKTPPPPLTLSLGRQRWGDFVVTVSEDAEPNGGQLALLGAETAAGILTVAGWDGTGRLAVENGSRTVKRLFADRGIPVEQRENYPALYLDGRLIAVPGVAVDRRYAPGPGERTLAVCLEKISKE